jgi:ubiquitin carboxyl-terminal hydrolase 25/28
MRLEAAKAIDPDRADENMARPVDALDYLGTYLTDSLQPKTGKTRIPLLNRKFLKTFGKDCDEMLSELGFRRQLERDDDADADVVVWNLPQPQARFSPSDPDNERTLIEDVRYELTSLIMAMSESDRKQIRNATQPQPSLAELRRALGCLDYDKRLMPRSEARNINHEEEHPYYAGLGAMADFSDALILFAYARQTTVDLANSTYYFECLQDIAIGRNSSMLGEHVQILASQGQVNRKEVSSAYAYLGIEPGHAGHLTDDIIIGRFRARLQDISPAVVEETRNALRIIGNARQSQKIIQEASNAIETYEQALSWLDLDAGQTDDFVVAMFGVKTNDSPSNREIAVKAVRIIAEARKSQRLMDFVNTGNMDAPEMDVSEAYALLGVADRSAALDLDVLQAQMQSYNTTNPQNEAKYEQAYALICKDQQENHKDTVIQESGPPKKHYPLSTWPVGCQNIGNTCYLNSVLQFLFTIRHLRDMVLDFDSYKEQTTPEALENKRVGRSAVTVEKVQKAQEFVFELRNLFKTMITAPSESVRPPIRLACLALLKDDSTVIEKLANTDHSGLGDIGGVPVHGPMPNPETRAQSGDAHVPELADSVMGDANDDKKSETSSTVALADPEEDKFFDEPAKFDNDKDFEILNKPGPPSRPPPVPPRPQTATQAAQATQASTELKVVEEVARQQDAAEILNNVFDLLSCAMKGTNTMEDGEQVDLIKQLFFSEVGTVRNKNGAVSQGTALQDHLLITPGDRDRHLYAALDDEFGLQDLETDATSSANGHENQSTNYTKYEYFVSAAPILIVNVRRIAYEGGRSKKIESHVGLDDTLYLDRYLEKTNSLSKDQLLERRQKQWDLTKKLKALEARKAALNKTELQVSLAEAVDEAANFLANVVKDREDGSVEMGGVTIFDTQELHESARHLETEAQSLDAQMKEIDAQISSLFEDCKDHPYRLHSVFIHRGTAAGGHYWIFIHDFQNNIWRKYNDERVDEVEDLKDIFTQEEKYPATSTGIVYVKEDLKDVVTAHVITEAVCRDPVQPAQDDVEMKDADTMATFGQTHVPVINGVESW